MDKYRNTILFNVRLNRIILVIFFILTLFSVFLVRAKLLDNAQQVGFYLAWNKASEEQNIINIYSTFVELGTETIDQKLSEGADLDEIYNVLSDLFENIKQTIDNSHMNLYALVNGNILSLNHENPLSDYNYMETDWYREALKADGDIVFTDLYTDSMTGDLVFTISKKSKHTDSVLMFDIFIDNFHLYSNTTEVPDGSSYFLCDKSGNVLYYSSNINLSYEDANKYSKELVKAINNPDFDAYNYNIKDPAGNPQGVYFYKMENGWISILTTPIQKVLDELNRFIVLFSLVFFAILAIIIFMTTRDYNMHRRISHITDTVQVLGNSYYAIYRVNYQDETYEAIKFSDDVEKKLVNVTGNYTDLINAIGGLVDESTFKEFKSSFSIENIRTLVDENVKDYGGYFLRKFDDEFKWVSIRMLVDNQLMTNEVVLCFRDVDRDKKSYLKHIQLLESALDAARENEKAKTTFFSSMSHDMRTPLNIIINLSDLIKQNADEPHKVLNYIKKIDFSSKQLLTLINDLLEISRLEHTDISLSNTVIDLVDCIKTCSESFSELAKQENKNFNISFDIQNKMVISDASRINQIVNNLLSNAFKYSEKGASVSISLKQCQQGSVSRYQIVVSDTGIGISEEFLEHIFDSYARETRFCSQNVNGTGLGMPIVQRLVNHMGGEITVDSTLGVGSTFTVTLPFKLADEESTDTSQENNTDSNGLVDLNGLNILLAEDNEINMEIAKEILEMQGVNIFPAVNGKEAVDIFKEHEEGFFDAILMDMLMPVMDGCEASKTIRSLDRDDAQTIPIIAVTANAFAEDIAKTTEAKMNAHISKPIDFPNLCKTLKKLIK